MDISEVLIDGFGRVKEVVHSNLESDATLLTYRPDSDANTIAWLVWHLTRVQDDHVAGVSDREQAWTEEGWVKKFDLPFDDGDVGFGHSSEDVAAVVAAPDLLRGYFDATHGRTVEFLRSLSNVDYDRVVDENWDPPVTLAVRLVSVLDDCIQHAGQASYIRGLAERS